MNIMESKIKERLANLPTFATKEEALREAVKVSKEDDGVICMVERTDDGKYVICDWKNWEMAFRAGYEPIYGSDYIYNLAVGRNPTEEENQRELKAAMGTGWKGSVTKAATYADVRKKKAKKKKPELSPADCDRWDTPPGATYTISNPKHDE